MKRALLAVAACLTVVAGLSALSLPEAPDPAKVDAVFSKWTSTTPGCAVGVSQGGKPVLEKAYGMADLEHDVPNAADTIFEAGSVSKQFTAAAVLLLARDGKLSLDDPARKYVPELPDYGKPLTIRHLLTHTSGLRDWGEVQAIAGWPRTSRIYTHTHVLDIVSRQRSLNFEPGTNWSYSNTGYNLAAIIVSRVSGVPFAEFCRTRIFEPLGMTRTSWRDDFRRVVKGRAIAYNETMAVYRQYMPFENAHGNGGLLTTVGDLLRWNENVVTQKVGDPQFLREQLQPGTFNDGRAHDYAMGLFIRTFVNVPEVGHSGSTAGYRAYLARFPNQHVSVAVLCNVSSAEADAAAHTVAALYLGRALEPSQARQPGEQADETSRASVVASRAGLYRSAVTGVPLGLLFKDGQLTLDGVPAPANVLVPSSASQMESPASGRTFDFDDRGVRVTSKNGTAEVFERTEPVKPMPDDLRQLEGVYASDEADAVLEVAVKDGTLVVGRRPATVLVMQPVYRDAFQAPGLGLVRFRRDAAGKVTALSVIADRVWDMRFERR